MDADSLGKRPYLEQLADETLDELVASGDFAIYAGRLPPRASAKLRRLTRRLDDEALLEDIFAERMIALTRNELVEEISDENSSDQIVSASHDRPVMVYISSDYCRPCNHILPVVYQLAEKYRHALTVVKINISKNVRFRESFLGPVQMTPAFLFFRNGEAVPASGPIGRLLGQTAFIANTRENLEIRIKSVVGNRLERSG